jgi:4-oxalocrotonate tautomerase
MPLVNVKVIEGVFTPQQKQEIVERLTATMVSIEGETLRQVTWVVVEEVKSGEWGIAGQPLTTEAVRKPGRGAVEPMRMRGQAIFAYTRFDTEGKGTLPYREDHPWQRPSPVSAESSSAARRMTRWSPMHNATRARCTTWNSPASRC